MNDLLQFAIDAHGGLDHWRRWSSLSADLSIGGALWDAKARPGLLTHTAFMASLHEQHAEISLPNESKLFCFSPQQVSVRSDDGTELSASGDPRATFAALTQDPHWSDVQLGYFNGYALWQYFTAPFLYASPGFNCSEEAPWHENGEVWRVLRVTFPNHIASHTRVQRAYYGPDGLLRRHQYVVDVLGGAQAVNYADDFVQIGGIMLPMRRRVYGHDASGRKISDPLLVSIDVRGWRFL